MRNAAIALLGLAVVLILAVGCGGNDKGTNPPPPKLVQLTSSPSDELQFHWSPDGSKIAFSTGGQGGLTAIWVVAADGGTAVQTTADSLNANGPRWSPDGSKIAFQGFEPETENQNLWVMDATGRNAVRLTRGHEYAYNPTWSPDGRKIAFMSDRGGYVGGDIWVVTATGGEPTQLTQGRWHGNSFSWSPDGTTIVYALDTQWAAGIVVIPAAGGTPLQLVPLSLGDGGEGGPRWSPDGTKIAYASIGNVWVIPSEGGTATQITTQSGNSPEWSPDGSKIAFARGAVGSHQLLMIPAAGGNETQIVDTEDNVTNHQWSPDGKKLAFASDRSGNWDIWVIALD